MNIVFFGSSSYVIPIIEILKKNFELKLVLTTERSGGAVPSFCKQNKIEFLSVSSLKDQNTQHLILSAKAPVAVLADFGLIIPKNILNTFSKGIINLHPSLLPKYRGPTPVQTAILNGDKITGISIMKLDEQIDHGPLLAQEKEEILDTDTAESLYKRLFAKGANLLPIILNKYLGGSLNPIPQNDKNATFTKSLTRQHGHIEISKIKDQKSKLELERKIKAYFPWPGTWTQLRIKDKLLRIKLLPENKLQVEGKKPVSYKDFLNGYPDAKEVLEKIKN